MHSSLDKNVFFRTFVTQYPQIYLDTIDKRWLICAPVFCNYKEINENYILKHIFQPSHHLKDHYNPCIKQDITSVEYMTDHLIVRKPKVEIQTKIIKEEIGFNSRNENFKILIIERPLVTSKISMPIEYFERPKCLFTYKDCTDFLYQISPNNAKKIKEKIFELSRSYLILPDYLYDAKHKIQEICDESLMLYEENLNQLAIDKDDLATALESFTIGIIYNSVFEVVKQRYSEEDTLIYNQCCNLNRLNLPIEYFQITKYFSTFETNDKIIKEVNSLDECITPSEKVICLKRVKDLITDALNQSAKNKNPFENTIATSDDILPATIISLYTTKIKNLCSHLSFIEIFGSSYKKEGELCFTLTTFQAAMTYIRKFSLQNEQTTKETQSTTDTDIDIELKDPELEELNKLIEKIMFK